MHMLFAGLGCAAVILVSAIPAAAAEQSADARFKAIYTREWTWREAQFAGEDDEDSHTKPVKDHLPKLDPATQAMRQAYWENVLKEVEAIPEDKLSPQSRVDYEVYKPQLEVLINDQKFRDYEMPVNSDSAFWSDMSAGARDRHFEKLQDFKNYIAWLNDLPRYFGEQIDNMRAGLKRGFTSPQVTLKGRDLSASAIVDAKGEDNPYYAPFKKIPATFSATDRADLKAAGLKAVNESVTPSYVKLLAFLREEYIPGARTTLAAEAMPDGKAFYHAKILEFTTLDMTADQIHQLGLDEVARIHTEMLDTMKETGFQGDLPAFLHFLRTDPQFYAKTPQELLDKAAWIAKVFDGKAAQYFGYLPRSRFTIKPVPAEIAPYYTSGRGGPGVYLVNTYDLPSRPLYSLTALTLHESAPGHAFQIPIAAEHKDQPAFRREVYISAYGEGWALYSERLGDEMGMYETPYQKFGMLSYQMWRACRLVVDTGIHHLGWTREQAVQYMLDNTALAPHEIDTEVDRYIAWPGQALSYYLGEMTIWKARHKAEQALGSKFNIRAFHDTVLELGSVPMPVLTKRIDKFIADGGKGPYPDME
jgi:uncharacterized protein (DUF885 family)